MLLLQHLYHQHSDLNLWLRFVPWAQNKSVQMIGQCHDRNIILSSRVLGLTPAQSDNAKSSSYSSQIIDWIHAWETYAVDKSTQPFFKSVGFKYYLWERIWIGHSVFPPILGKFHEQNLTLPLFVKGHNKHAWKLDSFVHVLCKLHIKVFLRTLDCASDHFWVN